MPELTLSDFPVQSYDKLRYRDTDRQGHVNNAVFSTFLETGRVEILYNPEVELLSDDASFVIASLTLHFRGEIHWPGTVETGTIVKKIGNSSITLFQRVFQKNVCVAEAETVVVQLDNATKRSKKLSDMAVQKLSQLMRI